jgi:predicted acyl esterase
MAPVLAQESVKLEINVSARMRDGVDLYADVYRPDDAARHPAIIDYKGTRIAFLAYNSVAREEYWA